MTPRKGEKQAKLPRRPAAGAVKRVVYRALVVVDQGPLRRKAATECGREMAKLEKARTEWKRFENDDKRAYARWSAATFGPLLSKLREVEAALREKEMLLQEVEMEMVFGGGSSPRSAYRRVMKRRNAPPPTRPDGAGWDDGPPPPGSSTTSGDSDGREDDSQMPKFSELDDFEQEFLFEEFLIHVMGMNPDRMSDARYYRMFAEFKAKLEAQEEGESDPGPGPESDPRQRGQHHAPPPPANAPGSPAARVKELYRLLVRRLHPDTRAERDVEVSALWHEVQEAYSTGNIERLEMLLAFTDIQLNEVGDHTSLFQMRSVLAELRRSLKALQKNLREARKEPAWNFSRASAEDRSGMEWTMRMELKARLSLQECELQRLEGLIASWADRPKTEAPPGKGRGKKRAPFAEPDLPW